MAASHDSSDKRIAPPEKSTVILLLADIADTTWRMFLGPIIGALLGFWADTTWHTSPWLSLAGVLFGCGLTALLIKQLLQKVGNAK